jgi:hypothetical protein
MFYFILDRVRFQADFQPLRNSVQAPLTSRGFYTIVITDGLSFRKSHSSPEAKTPMTFKRSFISDEKDKKEDERRSGLNRRWIKAPYEGVERRSGADRRNELTQAEPSSAVPSSDGKMESLEKIVLSTTLRLEALARLLVAKGVLRPEELTDMLQNMQAEYQPHQLKED